MIDKTICLECGRVFNLIDEAEEWFFGHDCEA